MHRGAAARAASREDRFYLVAIPIILLAFFLRVRSLDSRSLWFDEAMEYWVATASFSQLLRTVRAGLQDPPLFSVLLHFWMMLGKWEFLLRYLSLMFSTLSVAGLMLLSRRFLGGQVGVVAGALMAASAPQIRYAQEVGQYALMGCILVFGLLALGQALHRPEKKRWWIWSGAVVAGLYSYYGMAIPLAAVGLTSFLELIFKRQGPMLRRFVLSTAASLAAAVPLLLLFLPAQIFRGPTSSAFQGEFGDLLSELTWFANASRRLIQFQLMGNQARGFAWPAVPQWSTWLPVVVALLFALSELPRHRATSRRLLIWLLVTWLLHYIAGRFNLFPFGFRYSLVVAPLLLVVTALGIWRAGKVHWTLGAGILVWILSVSVLVPSEPQEDLRTVTRFWTEHRIEGEITYVYYGAVPAFRYYLDQATTESVASSVSPLWYGACWRGESLCPSSGGVFYGAWYRHLAPTTKMEATEHTLGGWPHRMWVMFSHVHLDEDRQILGGLEEMGYSLVLSRRAENASVHLLERK